MPKVERKKPFPARRRSRPGVESLEGRQLLNATPSAQHVAATAHVEALKKAAHAEKVSHPATGSDTTKATHKAATHAATKVAHAAAKTTATAKTTASTALTVSPHAELIVSPLVTPITQATAAPVPGVLTPIQLRTAYGVAQLPNEGAGVTIGIVNEYDDPNIGADVNAYSTQYGLPLMDGVGSDPILDVVKDTTYGAVAASPTSGSSDTSGETSLDVEVAHAMAPLANIILVEWPAPSTNGQFAQYLAHAVQLAAKPQSLTTPGAANDVPVVVSASYGSGEFSGDTASPYDTYATGDAGNIAVTVSTGDSGKPPGYPGVSSNVIGVGGTSLYVVSARGRYSYETAWGGVANAGAGGGGLSTTYTSPTFQSSNGVTYSNRAVPDVSMVADATTSVSVYDSYDEAANGGSPWTAFGGTSVASPLFAGVLSLAQEDRVDAGLKALSTAQIQNLLYSAYSHPVAYSTYFHDITTGTNTYIYTTTSRSGVVTTHTVTGYNAATGYDLATGIGSPIANTLVPYLAANVAATA